MKKTIFVLKLMLIMMFATANHSVGNEQEKSNGKIIVKIEGLNSSEGVLRSHLYNNAKYFPIECDYAVRKCVAKISNNKAEIVYENVPYGTYALTVHHDANNNGKMDRNFIGYPQEGFGVSNNPRIMLSLPNYEDCKFILNSETKTIIVKLKFT